MTRDRLGKLAALARGAALVGIGACSNNETLVQAPSAPVGASPAGSDAGSDVAQADDGGAATELAQVPGDGGGAARWRHHGTPNALPPRIQPKPSGDAGP